MKSAEEKLCLLRKAVLEMTGLPDDKLVLLAMAQEMNNNPQFTDERVLKIVVALIESL